MKRLHVLWTLVVFGLAALVAAPGVRAQGAGTAPDAWPEIRLRIVGGLAGVNQYVRHEAPFWTRRLPELTGGKVTAEIAPFDQSGILGRDMLRLIHLGVVPFGTAILSVVSSEDPELGGTDLPLLNPDFATLRRNVAVYRPYVAQYLRQNYDIEVLSIYTYPAQVVYCRRPFEGLSGLAGRRVRVAAVDIARLMPPLGATAVVLPFAEIVSALRNDVVDCAITGTMSGYTIGIPAVASHVHQLAIAWGPSVFVANGAAWRALPERVRMLLHDELAVLEEEIWAAAEAETDGGIDCLTGRRPCAAGRPATMSLVPLSDDDRNRARALLGSTVLPGWIDRCGAPCIAAWDGTIGPLMNLPAPSQ